MITDAIKKSILEPLSEATGHLIEPLEIYPTDFLLVREETDRFGNSNFHLSLKRLRANEDTSNGSWEDYPKLVVQGVEYRETRDYRRIETERFFNRIPECKPVNKNRFTGDFIAAATDVTALIIHHCWPREAILFSNEETEVQYNYLILRFLSQTNRVNIVAEFKSENRIVPAKPDDWIDHPERPLSDYQLIGTYLALGQESLALHMDRGTGKTATVIQTICMEARRHFKETGKMFRALAIVPPQVRINWLNEMQRFAISAGKVVVVDGGKFERIRQVTQGMTSEKDCQWSLCIISYDSMVNTMDTS